MGPLSRLRAWIAGAFGSGDTGESPSGEDAADDDDESDADPTGLDPSAATETRAGATDDAVDALRDVRRSREGPSTDERTPSDSGDADRDPP